MPQSTNNPSTTTRTNPVQVMAYPVTSISTATPTPTQQAMSGALFYDPAVFPPVYYVAGSASFVQQSGSGSSAFSALTGQPTDNPNLAAAFNAKQSIAQNWNGTTPALASGVSPIAAGFGGNAFVYTGAGGATLDGNTYQTGDLAVFNGTAWTKFVLGGGYLGSFASTSALQSAYPAASNPASVALVSGVLYFSTGTAWQIKVTASTDLSDAAVFNQQSTNAQTGTSYTLVLSDAGLNVDMNNASANTLTIPPNSSVPFPLWTLITVTQAGAGTTTIAAGAGVTINKPSADSLSISAQYRTAQLYKTATDTWRVLAN